MHSRFQADIAAATDGATASVSASVGATATTSLSQQQKIAPKKQKPSNSMPPQPKDIHGRRTGKNLQSKVSLQQFPILLVYIESELYLLG